jgi:hypothetical protein
MRPVKIGKLAKAIFRDKVNKSLIMIMLNNGFPEAS